MPKPDTMPQVQRFWNDIAPDFDAIYTGKDKSSFSRTMDRIFRKDIYQRFDWVMEKTGDVRGKSVCDIGCGSGRFVTALAQKGAAHVAGVDVAPNMLTLAKKLVDKDGVGNACSFYHADVLNWTPPQNFDISIAIGFWDYIADPAERLRLIRAFTTHQFLSAWPRYYTWRMPVRRVRLGALGCPVYFFKKPDVFQMIEKAGFRVESCVTLGQLFCVDARPV